MSGRMSSSFFGRSVSRMIIDSCTVSAGKGSLPVSMLNATSASEYVSLRPSSVSPASCSGLMYSGVPTTSPVLVTFWASLFAAFAIPKSTTFTQSVPSRFFANMMLSGLRSRWTIPMSCATLSASAVWRVMSPARVGVSAPSSLITFVSDGPSTYSIARKIMPSSVSPKS